MGVQAREGREGQQKIAALERSLQQVLADFDAERQMLLQNSGQQLAEAQAESNSLKRLIKCALLQFLLVQAIHLCISLFAADTPGTGDAGMAQGHFQSVQMKELGLWGSDLARPVFCGVRFTN